MSDGLGEYWEPSTEELPAIKVFAGTAVPKEIAVIDDATGWPFSKVMDACQARASEWRIVNDRLLG